MTKIDIVSLLKQKINLMIIELLKFIKMQHKHNMQQAGKITAARLGKVQTLRTTDTLTAQSKTSRSDELSQRPLLASRACQCVCCPHSVLSRAGRLRQRL